MAANRLFSPPRFISLKYSIFLTCYLPFSHNTVNMTERISKFLFRATPILVSFALVTLLFVNCAKNFDRSLLDDNLNNGGGNLVEQKSELQLNRVATVFPQQWNSYYGHSVQALIQN